MKRTNNYKPKTINKKQNNCILEIDSAEPIISKRKGEQVNENIVNDKDMRERIQDYNIWPYSAIGLVYMTFDGKQASVLEL